MLASVDAIADGRGSDCYSTPFQTDVEENYHQIPLKAEQIVDVDTIEAFEAMCEALRPHYILAMDCEFYTVGSNAMVALMQIACQDKVYLVDLYTIFQTSDKQPDLWNNLLGDVLSGDVDGEAIVPSAQREPPRETLKGR